MNFQDFTANQIPTAKAEIGQIKKATAETNPLFALNEDILQESILHYKYYYGIGDKFPGGRRALAVCGLSNIMRNAAIGGNQSVGCTDFYINEQREEYPNLFREDDEGWVLILYCCKEEKHRYKKIYNFISNVLKRLQEETSFRKTKKRIPTGKARLLQMSYERGTPIRIFAGSKCPFRRSKNNYTLYPLKLQV